MDRFARRDWGIGRGDIKGLVVPFCQAGAHAREFALDGFRKQSQSQDALNAQAASLACDEGNGPLVSGALTSLTNLFYAACLYLIGWPCS